MNVYYRPSFCIIVDFFQIKMVLVSSFFNKWRTPWSMTNQEFHKAMVSSQTKIHTNYKTQTYQFFKISGELFKRCISQVKVEIILKGSLASIPSPLPSVKIQIMGWKVCLRCKGKTLLGVVNQLLKTKSLLTSPSNVLPLHFKQTFQPIIWIFTEGEGDGIESGLSP